MSICHMSNVHSAGYRLLHKIAQWYASLCISCWRPLTHRYTTSSITHTQIINSSSEFLQVFLRVVLPEDRMARQSLAMINSHTALFSGWNAGQWTLQCCNSKIWYRNVSPAIAIAMEILSNTPVPSRLVKQIRNGLSTYEYTKNETSNAKDSTHDNADVTDMMRSLKRESTFTRW